MFKRSMIFVAMTASLFAAVRWTGYAQLPGANGKVGIRYGDDADSKERKWFGIKSETSGTLRVYMRSSCDGKAWNDSTVLSPDRPYDNWHVCPSSALTVTATNVEEVR